MKCKHVDDVPHSNGKRGWSEKVQCDDEAIDGERYCEFHKVFHQNEARLDEEWLKKLHD